MKTALVVVVIAMLGAAIAQTEQPVKQNSLIDRARKGDDSALREMEHNGDIQDLKILLHDQHYANRSYMRELLAKMGDRESLQYYACRSMTDDILHIEDLMRQELDGIGGDFAVEVYRHLLDSDSRFRPQIERFMEQERKHGGDVLPTLPSTSVLVRLPKLVPNSAFPELSPIQIQLDGQLVEESKAQWRTWIDSHQVELQKLRPTAKGINFDLAHCSEAQRR